MSNAPEESKQASRPDLSAWSLFKLATALGLLAASAYICWSGDTISATVPPPPPLVDVNTMTYTDREVCGAPRPDGAPVIVSMLYSDDKAPWVKDAAEVFAHRCPNIEIKLTAMNDLESVDAILDGKVDPTLWSPADDLVLRYLEHRWKQRSSEDLFDRKDRTSLVLSPLVVLMWEDRLRVVDTIRSAPWTVEGPWMDMACAHIPRDPGAEEIPLANRVPGTWSELADPLLPATSTRKPAKAGKKAQEAKSAYPSTFPPVEELQRWGRVKLGHAPPTRSTAGLEALYLMAYDYSLPPAERTAPQLDDVSARPEQSGSIRGGERFREDFEQAFADQKEPLRRWLRRCEGGLDSAPESAQLLTERMFQVGGARYDGVVTYEHLAFPVLNRIDGHEEVMRNLRIVYPQTTLVNQHPVVVLRGGDPARQEQTAAARRWIGFLRSAPMQEKAIEYGFRPAIREVSVVSHNVETNPFLHLRRYGVSLEPVFEEPPRLEGEAVQELINLWKDATGRN